MKRGDQWVEEPHAAHGAFAPMGGLFSSVRDLAAWAAWFAAAFPSRDDPDGASPLTRSSRREMQQVQRSIMPELRWASAARLPTVQTGGYGYGLFVELDVARGRVVSHSGGYPGFGSHMRWHPASGIGVVGVANGRYARINVACREALELLVDREIAPIRRPTVWPAVVEAKVAVEGLVNAWDDEVAERLFAMNVALDEDLATRRAAITRLRDVHGVLPPGSVRARDVVVGGRHRLVAGGGAGEGQARHPPERRAAAARPGPRHHIGPGAAAGHGLDRRPDRGHPRRPGSTLAPGPRPRRRGRPRDPRARAARDRGAVRTAHPRPGHGRRRRARPRRGGCAASAAT